MQEDQHTIGTANRIRIPALPPSNLVRSKVVVLGSEARMDRRFFRSRKMAPAQSRAARGLLGWSVRDTAEKAKIAKETLRAFENGRRYQQTRNTIARIRHAYEQADVLFWTDGYAHGVSLELNALDPINFAPARQ
ncbi:MAG TPA: hypothetical protein VLK33_06110 [Terriglobales bacterium]|nr:hypothetical protein [Terriglobales bacterium]